LPKILIYLISWDKLGRDIEIHIMTSSNILYEYRTLKEV